MTILFKELRWAVRRLVRAPAPAIAGLVVLALAIGCTVTVYAVARAVLLDDLPFSDPDRLVLVERVIDGEPTFFHSPADLADLRDRSEAFEQVSASARFRSILQGGSEAVFVTGASVTPEYLSTLGAAPALGRIFRAGVGGGLEEAGVAVVSWDLWKSGFGGARDIVGKEIRLDDGSYRVIGVMPSQLGFLGTDLWVPGPHGLPSAPFEMGPELLTRRDVAYLSILGRLRPGATLDSMRPQVAALGERIAAEYPAGHPPVQFDIEPLKRIVTAEAARHLGLLAWAVGVASTLASLAVAGLLIARGVERTFENDVRRALGASLGQRSLGVLAEGALLALGGGAAGVLFAVAGVRWFLSHAPPMPRDRAATVDAGVLGFVLLVVLGVTVMAGSLPALLTALRKSAGAPGGGRRGMGRATRRSWTALLTVEIGLMVVLLVTASLLAQRFVELRRLDLGFEPDGLVVASVVLPREAYPDPSGRVQFVEELVRRLEAAPDTEAAAAVVLAPMVPGLITTSFSIRGRPVTEGGAKPGVELSAVTDRYFRTMGIPILAGRSFLPEDLAGSPEVAIVSEAAARRYWGDESPLGAELELGDGSIAEVVGVAGDARYDLAPRDSPGPRLYRPVRQNPWPSTSIVARRRDGAEEAGTWVRRTVDGLDARVPVTSVSRMDESLAEARRPTRYLLFVLGALAISAALVAAVGLYGLIATRARAEEHDLAVRLALGAGRGRLVRAGVAHGLSVAGLGIAVGLVGSFLAHEIFRTSLPGHPTPGPWLLMAVAGLAVVIAGLASLPPALRVLRLDPSRSLRGPEAGPR